MPDRLRRLRGTTLPALALACLVAPTLARAADKPGYPIQCFEDPASKQQYCFAPSKLSAKGDSRSSPLFKGVGADLAITPWIVVADCKKGTVALRDANNAPAKGERVPRADLGQALAEDMCAVKLDASGTRVAPKVAAPAATAKSTLPAAPAKSTPPAAAAKTPASASAAADKP